MYSGRDKEGDWFQLFQIGFGGIPGKPFGDGPDGHSLWPGFTNVPNEFLERYFPLRIERYEALADSGGAGKFRGGNGILMSYRFLASGTVSIHDDRWFTYPWGVNGGKPGQRARKVLEKADGSVLVVPNKKDSLAVEEGDILHFITWGGGGWGNPLERDPALVAKEVRQGLVTTDGARRYGVVCDGSGKLDEAATATLRQEMHCKSINELFDRGGTIAELRERCETETGLPAPKPPVWNTAAMAVE
jgi:N-methylhydantoinase B